MDYVTGVMTRQGYKRFFTPDGITKLKQLKGDGVENKDIADKLGASLGAVRYQLSCLGMGRTNASGWNDERVTTLKKLWSEGFSASQIAGRLGGVTRCAVIGKVHRLGLQGRATTSRIRSRAKRARTTLRSKPAIKGNPVFRAMLAKPTIDTEAMGELIIPVKERKTIETLEECSCRWPIGDPLAAEFHFCGKEKIKGLSYCEFHARKAFQISAPTKRRINGVVEGKGMVERADEVLEAIA